MFTEKSETLLGFSSFHLRAANFLTVRIFIFLIRCCESPQERSVLSQCIPYLAEGLGNEYDEHIHCASICALSKLSRDFENCAFLRENNTTKVLAFLISLWITIITCAAFRFCYLAITSSQDFHLSMTGENPSPIEPLICFEVAVFCSKKFDGCMYSSFENSVLLLNLNGLYLYWKALSVLSYSR